MRRKICWEVRVMIRVVGILIWYMGGTRGVGMEKKAEVGNVIGSGGGGEGNTSFVEGTTWCIAHPGAAQVDVQSALDWACGLGKADCSPIRPPHGRCFHPNTLLAHASFAFNAYYQQNGNSHIACNFGGTGIITKHDPSYDSCIYDSSASRLLKSSAWRPSSSKSKLVCWKLTSVLMFFVFRI